MPGGEVSGGREVRWEGGEVHLLRVPPLLHLGGLPPQAGKGPGKQILRFNVCFFRPIKTSLS